jgi:cell wall-associated NlpC family hydrolase
LKNLKKISYLSFCAFFVSTALVTAASAQDRPRVISTMSSRPINQPPATRPTQTEKTTSSPVSRTAESRPTLTNRIEVAAEPLVKKTSMMSAATTSLAAGRTVYNPSASLKMMGGIQNRLGIPYLYGSTGPNRYDCSGFVWAVFKDAGIDFERSSARTLWSMSTPVEGDERYKFGTLVFLNGLGHMGIVADENGFYHASSSKGITYSPFKGYWEKRIVGFRRLPNTPAAPPSLASPTAKATEK